MVPNMRQIECPRLEILRLFDAGRISDEAQFSEIASHIDSCAHCLGQLDRVQQDTEDAVIPRQKVDADRNAQPDPFESEPECARAVALVEALPRHRNATALPDAIGAYRIVDILGHGGMGVAYKAWHQHLKRRVVLKLIGHLHSASAQYQGQFAIEQEIIGKLNHPNIATAYDAGVHDETPFLVLEYVEGLTLQEMLRLEESFSVESACSIVREIALGLQYIHDAGFIHRDIKPANVMVTPDRKIKILDFGLALATQSTVDTVNGGIAGTRNFRAPEQCIPGMRIDHRADLYSLGAVFFALLTGSAPVAPSKTDTTETEQNTAKSGPTPSRLPHAIPDELSGIIDSLLAPSPDERPASAQIVADVLLKFTAQKDFNQYSTGPGRSSLGKLNGSPHSVSQMRTDEPLKTKPGLSRSRVGLLIAVLVTAVLLGRIRWENIAKHQVSIANNSAAVDATTVDRVPVVNLNSDFQGAASGNRSAPVSGPSGTNHSSDDHDTRMNGRESTTDTPSAPKSWKPGPASGQLDGLVTEPARLDGVLHWQMETRLPRGLVRRIAWDPAETRLACASDDGHVRIFDREQKQGVTSLKFSHLLPFNGSRSVDFRSLAWNSLGDGLLISDSHFRSKVHLWNVAERQLVLNYKAHQTGTSSVAWSPDGSRFVTAGIDGHARVWDREQHLCGGFSQHVGAIHAVAWHPSKVCGGDGWRRLPDSPLGSRKSATTCCLARPCGVGT
jgi:serine/threonine protein kinase